MVRLLFIRHGMTNSNLRDARMAIRVAKGQVRALDAEATELREVLAEEDDAEASGDTALSDYKGGGIAEAQLLAEYWGDVLSAGGAGSEIEDGAGPTRVRLHAYSSAMRRCLQTAEPLCTALDVPVTVTPLIMEVPGLCGGVDRQWLHETVRPLVAAAERRGRPAKDARADERQVEDLLAGRPFARCGLCQNDIAARWPMARRFQGFPTDPAVPWSPGRWENPKATQARVAACREWLLGLGRDLPASDIVLLFSHGDFIWKEVCALVGIDHQRVGHQLANTSVTSLVVGADGEVSVDFVNRTPHLVGYDADRLNRSYYRFTGLQERPAGKGKRGGKGGGADLGRQMVEGRRAFDRFLARL